MPAPCPIAATAGRPAGLALPPGRMPRCTQARPLKRWRYVGVYGPELMVCVGLAPRRPALQSLLGGLGPRGRRLLERTRPGRGGVRARPTAPCASRRRRRDRPELGRDGVEVVSPTAPATRGPASRAACGRAGASGPAGRCATWRHAAWSTTPRATTRAARRGAGGGRGHGGRRAAGSVESRDRRPRRPACERADGVAGRRAPEVGPPRFADDLARSQPRARSSASPPRPPASAATTCSSFARTTSSPSGPSPARFPTAARRG